MSKLHYHDIARRNINKIYAVDSNVLINLAKYYYKGHCHDETETKEIKELVWLAKSPNGSLEYENAIIETCFDYSRNMLDVNALNGFMLAIDGLIMYCTRCEALNISGNYKPDMHVNKDCKINTILNCKIVNCFAEIKNGNIDFFLIYLYSLKIYELHQKSCLNDVEKLKNLYNFMAVDIGCISGLHFMLAQMLFMGTDEASDIAQKILKPKAHYTFKSVINAVADIYFVWTTVWKQNLFIRCKEPYDFVLVTQDIGLIELCKIIEKTILILDKESFTCLQVFSCDINNRKFQEWHNFFEKIQREIEHRTLELALKGFDKEKVIDAVFKYIPILERNIMDQE